MHDISKETFKQVPLLDSIDNLVLDYLQRQGHHSTFTALPFKTSSPLHPSSTLLHRSQVIKLIKQGQILEALHSIKTNFGSYAKKAEDNDNFVNNKLISSKELSINKLLSFNQITFLLNIQHFIELLRGRNTIKAIAWVQSELLPRSQKDPGLRGILEEALGVLVYTEPEQSPMAWLFDQKHRYATLASLTNTTLLSISPDFDSLLKNDTNSSFSTSSPLETFLKHVKSLDTLIHDLNGFSNELEDRKWSTLHNLIDLETENLSNQTRGKFIKIIKNE